MSRITGWLLIVIVVPLALGFISKWWLTKTVPRGETIFRFWLAGAILVWMLCRKLISVSLRVLALCLIAVFVLGVVILVALFVASAVDRYVPFAVTAVFVLFAPLVVFSLFVRLWGAHVFEAVWYSCSDVYQQRQQQIIRQRMH